MAVTDSRILDGEALGAADGTPCNLDAKKPPVDGTEDDWWVTTPLSSRPVSRAASGEGPLRDATA
jgi:hypothetical protein